MMTETVGERIERELAEDWSSEDQRGDYGLALWGDEYREFFLELREKINAAIKNEREKTIVGEQVRAMLSGVINP